MLQAADIVQLRALLEAQRCELETLLASEQTDSRPVSLDQQSVGRVSRIDAIQQQQMAIASQQQARQQLQLVLRALQRIEDGDYGECLECGETIARARLEAQPFAVLCIACQSAREES